MKKYITIIFIGGILLSCENNKEVQTEQNNLTNDSILKEKDDSIQKVREQEVINLNIDDSKSFDTILESENSK